MAAQERPPRGGPYLRERAAPHVDLPRSASTAKQTSRTALALAGSAPARKSGNLGSLSLGTVMKTAPLRWSPTHHGHSRRTLFGGNAGQASRKERSRHGGSSWKEAPSGAEDRQQERPAADPLRKISSMGRRQTTHPPPRGRAGSGAAVHCEGLVASASNVASATEKLCCQQVRRADSGLPSRASEANASAPREESIRGQVAPSGNTRDPGPRQQRGHQHLSNHKPKEVSGLWNRQRNQQATDSTTEQGLEVEHPAGQANTGNGGGTSQQDATTRGQRPR